MCFLCLVDKKYKNVCPVFPAGLFTNDTDVTPYQQIRSPWFTSSIKALSYILKSEPWEGAVITFLTVSQQDPGTAWSQSSLCKCDVLMRLWATEGPNNIICPVFSHAAEPLPLMDLCRRVARLALGRERIQHIETLPLPQTLKNYLQYQWLLMHGPRQEETKAHLMPPSWTAMSPSDVCWCGHRCWWSRWLKGAAKWFVYTLRGFPVWMVLSLAFKLFHWVSLFGLLSPIDLWSWCAGNHVISRKLI